MAKKYIKIFDDTILKQTINQGTEDQRAATTLGSFSMGELAYTRDTGRVFVGDCGNNNAGSQSTIGGAIVGNKYLGMIDSAPLAYTIDSEHYDATYDEGTRHYPVYDEYSNTEKALLENNSRYRITGTNESGAWSNWSREAEYNTRYNAYNGDFMYDAAQNALIFFDKNIKTTLDSAQVQVKEYVDDDGNATTYLQYYDKDGNQLSSFDTTTGLISLNDTVNPDDVKLRTPFINYNSGQDEEGIENPSTANPKVYGDGFVVFRNVEPDNDTIEFVKKAYNSNGASVGDDHANPGKLTDNNYSHNLLSVVKVYAQAMDSAMDSRYFTRDGSDSWKIDFSCLNTVDSVGDITKPFTITGSSVNIEGTNTVSVGGINYKFLGDKSDNPVSDFEFVLENTNYNTYSVAIKRKTMPKYYISLGSGLSSKTGADYILLDDNAASLSDTTPLITIDNAGLGAYTKFKQPLYIAWTRSSTDSTIDNYTAIFDITVDPGYFEKNEYGNTVRALYTLNKSIITDNTGITYNDWFTENNKATDSNLLRGSYDLFGVTGNNSAATVCSEKVEGSPIIIGYNGITEDNTAARPASEKTPITCTPSMSINMVGVPYSDTQAWNAVRNSIDNAIAAGGSIYDNESVVPNVIFEYTYKEDSLEGSLYSLENYFEPFNRLYVKGTTDAPDINLIKGPLKFIFKDFGSVDLEYTDIDIFYNAANDSRKHIADVFAGKAEDTIIMLSPGIYARYITNTYTIDDEPVTQSIAYVTVTSEILNVYSEASKSGYFLNKVEAEITDVEESETLKATYEFAKNYVYTANRKLPRLYKDDELDDYYYLEEGNIEVKGYSLVNGTSITTKTPAEVIGNDVLNGTDNITNEYTAVIIYTQSSAYVYYIRQASNILTADVPGIRDTRILIGGRWVTATISEIVPNEYKILDDPAALLLEINHTTDEHIEIFASSSIYDLKQSNNTIFKNRLTAAQLGDKQIFADTDTMYVKDENNVYTYKVPATKDNSIEAYNVYMPMDCEVNIFSSYGQSVSIVEIPMEALAGTDNRSCALRIAGLKSDTELTIRAIGYR